MVKTIGEEFFFRAMMAGYVAEGVIKAKVADMPGYKEIRYQDGDFLLVDRWCVNRTTQMSAGTTTMWHVGIPFWFMSYGGYYPESVINFLKKALGHSYSHSQFIGGRGPYVFADAGKSLSYVNHPRLNDFDRFEGREEIITTYDDRCVGAVVGYHEYWGMRIS